MVGLFASGPTSLIFYFAYSLWFVSEAIGAWLIPGLRNRGTPRVSRDRGSRRLILVSIGAAVFIAFSFGYPGVASLPNWVFYPGIFLILLGILIRQWAIAVLGRFFSLAVRVAEDHKVVDSDPYRHVRHPSYTGAMVTFIGLGLAVQSWGAARTAARLCTSVRLPDTNRREDVSLRTGLGLSQVHETYQATHSFPVLENPRVLGTHPQISPVPYSIQAQLAEAVVNAFLTPRGVPNPYSSRNPRACFDSCESLAAGMKP